MLIFHYSPSGIIHFCQYDKINVGYTSVLCAYFDCDYIILIHLLEVPPH